MLSQTRRALEDFDNQHEFERMAADVLNGLGYSKVEPMAPRGGSDGGQDIKFMEGDTPGIALVTLEKKIGDKFKRDLLKQENADGVIALFCNVNVSPSQKLEFAKEAIAKGYRLEVFDLERLRSLLDTTLKEVRRQYLGIDQQEDQFASEKAGLIEERLSTRSEAEHHTMWCLLVEGKLIEEAIAERLKANGFGMVDLNELKSSTGILDRDFVGNWFVKPEYAKPLGAFFQAVPTRVAALVFDPSSDKHVQRGNVTWKIVGGDQECDEYKYAIGVVNLSSKPIDCQLVLEHSDPHNASAQRLEVPLRVRGQLRESDGKFTLAPGNKQPTVYVEVLQELVLKSNPMNEHAVIQLIYANSADGKPNWFLDHRDHVLTFRLQGDMPKPVTIKLSVRSENRRYVVRHVA